MAVNRILNPSELSVLLLRTICLFSILALVSCEHSNGVAAPDERALDPNVAERINEFQERAKENPGDSLSMGELGIVYHLNGFYQNASECYAQAFELDPEEPRWVYYHAHISALNAKFDDALDMLSKAIRIEPSYLPAYIHQGNWLLLVDKPELAKSSFEKALDSFWDVPALVGIARVHMKLNEHNTALNILEPLALKYDLPYVHRMLANAHLQAGNVEYAQELLLKLGPSTKDLTLDDPWIEEQHVYSTKGFGSRVLELEVKLHNGEYATAIGELRQLRERFPNSKRVLKAYVVALRNLGNLEEALRQIDIGIQEFPKYYPLQIQKAELLRSQADFTSSLQHIKNAIEIDPHVADGYLSRARVYMDMNRWSEAKEAMKEAFDRGEGSPIAFVESAIVEGKLGNWQTSLDLLDNAILLDGTLAVAYLNQSRALTALGRIGEARTQLDLAGSYGAPAEQVQALRALIDFATNQ